jgi:hypothetical protein
MQCDIVSRPWKGRLRSSTSMSSTVHDHSNLWRLMAMLLHVAQGFSAAASFDVYVFFGYGSDIRWWDVVVQGRIGPYRSNMDSQLRQRTLEPCKLSTPALVRRAPCLATATAVARYEATPLLL